MDTNATLMMPNNMHTHVQNNNNSESNMMAILTILKKRKQCYVCARYVRLIAVA